MLPYSSGQGIDITNLSAAVDEKISPIEASLLNAIAICQQTRVALSDWKATAHQESLFKNVDAYIANLADAYEHANAINAPDSIIRYANVPQPALTTIDSCINPLLRLRQFADNAADSNDAARGTMSQVEIFRDTVDTLLEQWFVEEDMKEKMAAVQLSASTQSTTTNEISQNTTNTTIASSQSATALSQAPSITQQHLAPSAQSIASSSTPLTHLSQPQQPAPL